MAATPLIDEKIDLFSHAVSRNGHENTCDNFINSLPEPFDMRGVEVGVKQITIPTSWNPIPHRNRDASHLRWIVTFNKEASPFSSWDKVIIGPHTQWVGDGHRSILFTLNEGIYDTASDIVEQMIKQTDAAFHLLSDYRLWLVIANQTDSQRVFVRNGLHETSLFANVRLCQALHYMQQDPHGTTIPKYVALLFPPGYKSRDGTIIKESELPNYANIPNLSKLNDVFRPLDQLDDSSREPTITPENAIHLDHKPDLAMDPTNQIQRFFFYANFIQNRIVNGVKHPLLASVHNPGLDIKKTTLTHTIDYPVPQYVPATPITLQHLHVWLQDEHENPMSFAWGSVNILLHFRRRQGWDPHTL